MFASWGGIAGILRFCILTKRQAPYKFGQFVKIGTKVAKIDANRLRGKDTYAR